MKKIPVYEPQVYDTVRIPTKRPGVTQVGTVYRLGFKSKLVYVKGHDGKRYVFEEKNVFTPDMSCRNYKNFKWSNIDKKWFEPI